MWKVIFTYSQLIVNVNHIYITLPQQHPDWHLTKQWQHSLAKLAQKINPHILSFTSSFFSKISTYEMNEKETFPLSHIRRTLICCACCCWAIALCSASVSLCGHYFWPLSLCCDKTPDPSRAAGFPSQSQ